MPLKYLTALKNEFVVGLAFSLYFYVPYGCARNTHVSKQMQKIQPSDWVSQFPIKIFKTMTLCFVL